MALFDAAFGGTLIMLAMTSEGIVVAADSRATIPLPDGRRLVCDDQYKIEVPDNPPRTVVVVTGNDPFIGIPTDQGPITCKMLLGLARDLSVKHAVKEFLERKNVTLEELNLHELADHISSELRMLLIKRPSALRSFVGSHLFTVGIASYDPDSREGLLRGLEFSIDATGEVRILHKENGRFTPHRQQQAHDIYWLGETDILRQHLVGGAVGNQFLDHSLADFERVTAQERTADMAARYAANVIDAVSKIIPLVGRSPGVGGPVDVVLLGASARAQRLRWK